MTISLDWNIQAFIFVALDSDNANKPDTKGGPDGPPFVCLEVWVMETAAYGCFAIAGLAFILLIFYICEGGGSNGQSF